MMMQKGVLDKTSVCQPAANSNSSLCLVLSRTSLLKVALFALICTTPWFAVVRYTMLRPILQNSHLSVPLVVRVLQNVMKILYQLVNAVFQLERAINFEVHHLAV